MKLDAEKRSRSAIVAPVAAAGKTIALRALPWKSGMAQ